MEAAIDDMKRLVNVFVDTIGAEPLAKAMEKDGQWENLNRDDLAGEVEQALRSLDIEDFDDVSEEIYSEFSNIAAEFSYMIDLDYR